MDSAVSPVRSSPDETTGHAPAFAGPGPVVTLDALLDDRTRALPDATVLLEYGSDGRVRGELTFDQLHTEARKIARHLANLPVDRPLTVLSVHGGREFLIGFFGIILARRIAVPTFPPLGRRHQDRTAGILAQTGIGALLTEAALRPAFDALGASTVPQFHLDELVAPAPARPTAPQRAASASDVALIQFTSGSTAQPRGVLLTHRNLLANLGSMRRRLELGLACGETLVSWLPPYHDMGLIAKFLNAVYLGARLVWMPPGRFLRRPLAWLELISDHGAALSAAPNFAYDLCVDAAARGLPWTLDLSRWNIALNGAEPIRASTLERFAARFAGTGFRATAFYPGYGLAEATLAATGGQVGKGATCKDVSISKLRRGRIGEPSSPEDGRRLVSSGSELDGHHVRILAPSGDHFLGDCEIGEIVISGPSVSEGYHADGDASLTNGLSLPGESLRYLRTGDLGFLDRGELYVTGRIKDLIILHGENHYPQDLEHSAGRAAPELRPDACCAFSIETPEGEALVIVAAVRGAPETSRLTEIADLVTDALAKEQGVRVADVVLVRPGSIPQTTSGKLQRSLCRARLLEGELPILYRRTGDKPNTLPAVDDARLARLLDVLNQVAGQRVTTVGLDTPLDALGLDSIQRVRLRLALEDEFGLPPETEGATSEQTIGDLLDILPVSPERVARREDTPLPTLHRVATDSEAAQQATTWRQLWRDFATFQDITHLRHDSPVQLLRIAVALRRHPDIPIDRVVELATRWLEMEQFTGWFIHVPRIRALLADPLKANPVLWRQLEQIAQEVGGPAVITLFHTSGWDWLLALLIRAAAAAGRKLTILYDAEVADLTAATRRRFDAFLGTDSQTLESDGTLALLNLHARSLDALIHRHIGEQRWIIVLPDAVHARRARPGRVELPLLGGSIRLAAGIYQIAADRRLPLVHLPFHLGPDGPVLDPCVMDARSLAGCEPHHLRDATAGLLNVFLETLRAHPEQWRQWRLLVPAPVTPVPPDSATRLFDPQRILHVETVAAHWLMCASSQRVIPVPSNVWHALVDAQDEAEFRSRLDQEGTNYPRVDELLQLLAGDDPHQLFL